LSNSNGDSRQSYQYSVYGQVAASDPNHPNPYMFTGRRFDIETGLYYYRARYYNPHIGRFMQTDPVGYDDGINWYLYCGNNPLGMTDPSGLTASSFKMEWVKSGGMSLLGLTLYNKNGQVADYVTFLDYDELCHWAVTTDCCDIGPDLVDDILRQGAPGKGNPERLDFDAVDLVMALAENYIDSRLPYGTRQIYRSVVERAFNDFGIQRAWGWELTASGILRDPEWAKGPVVGFSDMYFEGEDLARAFTYSGSGTGANMSVAARGVFAIGIGGATVNDYSDTFHSIDVGGGALSGPIGFSGSVFWSPDHKFFGFAWGFGAGVPWISGSIDTVEYEQW